MEQDNWQATTSRSYPQLNDVAHLDGGHVEAGEKDHLLIIVPPGVVVCIESPRVWWGSNPTGKLAPWQHRGSTPTSFGNGP